MNIHSVFTNVNNNYINLNKNYINLNNNYININNCIRTENSLYNMNYDVKTYEQHIFLYKNRSVRVCDFTFTHK